MNFSDNKRYIIVNRYIFMGETQYEVNFVWDTVNQNYVDELHNHQFVISESDKHIIFPKPLVSVKTAKSNLITEENARSFIDRYNYEDKLYQKLIAKM